ncbi:serine hydrolase [Micromonospora sp. NBC_00617]|uniref:serine hydrolase n=1 Tax=Micromonospora sp. NBC_00617 TaxID=2903587 RepID=UPI0030E16D35
MRSRVTMVFAVVAVLLGGALLVPAAYARLSTDDSAGGGGGGASVAAPRPTPPPPPTLAAGRVSVAFKGEFFSWALLDRQTGKISGSPNMASTSTTESMIKAWIVSDYLRQLGPKKQPTAALKEAARLAIIESNDTAANKVHAAAGGSYKASTSSTPDAVIQRAIKICGLTDTKRGNVDPYTGYWSQTRMSPRDAARLGDCIADGRAAGPTWTKWVLDQMSKVHGSTAKKDQKSESGGGRWGIIDGLPKSITAQGPVSIKNGWTPISYDGNWHVNCLAVNEKWSLAVMLRYPIRSGLDYGAQVCASVTTQLVTPQPGAALKVPQQPVGKL